MESDDLKWDPPAKRKPKLEKVAEKAFVKWCRENGVKQKKLIDLGASAFPDRTILLGGGKIACIEFKKVNGRDQPGQQRTADDLRDLGVPVLRTESLAEAVKWTLQLLNR